MPRRPSRHQLAALGALVIVAGCGTWVAKRPNFAEAVPDPCAKEIADVEKKWQRPADQRGDAASDNVVSTRLTWIVRDATTATSHSYTFWSAGVFGRCRTSYMTNTIRISGP